MSVVGVGTDIIEISRLEKMSAKVLEKFALRVLTGDEYQHFLTLKQPLAYLAKRWAAKEATAKALGTGIAQGLSFQHMMVKSLPSGKPELVLTDKAQALAGELGATSWHLSLSDEKHYAIAFVVLSS